MIPNRPLRALTTRDIETLGELRAATDDALKHHWQGERAKGWVMPMDCGGTDGSHHSYTLRKLVRHGLVDMIKYGGKREKGSCRYRINTAGRALLKKQPK